MIGKTAANQLLNYLRNIEIVWNLPIRSVFAAAEVQFTSCSALRL
jgi:hypothetical protein